MLFEKIRVLSKKFTRAYWAQSSYKKDIARELMYLMQGRGHMAQNEIHTLGVWGVASLRNFLNDQVPIAYRQAFASANLVDAEYQRECGVFLTIPRWPSVGDPGVSADVEAHHRLAAFSRHRNRRPRYLRYKCAPSRGTIQPILLPCNSL